MSIDTGTIALYLTMIEANARTARESCAAHAFQSAAAKQPRVELAGDAVLSRIGGNGQLPASQSAQHAANAQRAQAVMIAATNETLRLAHALAGLLHNDGGTGNGEESDEGGQGDSLA